MWPYLRRSTTIDHNNDDEYDIHSPKSRRPPSSPNFKRRSFKDIETLTHDDDDVITTTEDDQTSSSSSSSQHSVPPQRPTVFHRVHLANRFTRIFSPKPKPEPEPKPEAEPEPTTPVDQSTGVVKKHGKPKLGQRVIIPGSPKRVVVVYMTSLRAVRSTFEACRTVRSILQGFRVPIDERDLMMEPSFFDEIRKIMAQIGQGRLHDRRVQLPKVFIGGRYIGGADEVVELHEIGELKKFMSGLPAAPPGVCETCGGFRFILCEECDGSHKCPLEDGGFGVCDVCNENGLIRCTSCSCC